MNRQVLTDEQLAAFARECRRDAEAPDRLPESREAFLSAAAFAEQALLDRARGDAR